MNNRPIGVFDSGLGGLTVVKEMNRILPNEQIVYFGDTGRVPYGTRSEQTIKKYARQDIKFLTEFDIKLVIIACGTASAVALEDVRPQFDVPIIGVVNPSAKAAVQASTNKKIGVLGTTGTIKSGEYQKKLIEYDPSVSIVAVDCPMFVPLVENGYLSHEVTYILAKEYLSRMQGVDTIILGCTHYPLLKKVISDIMGEGITLIDSGAEAAKEAQLLLEKMDMVASLESDDQYFVSDSVRNFASIGSMFLEREITADVQRVDIEKY